MFLSFEGFGTIGTDTLFTKGDCLISASVSFLRNNLASPNVSMVLHKLDRYYGWKQMENTLSGSLYSILSLEAR